VNKPISVSVVFAMPDAQHVMQLDVEQPCTARQAVNMAIEAGLVVDDADIEIVNAPLGIYGIKVSDATTLKSGDRVEIYRPLKQDPMELRRQRAASESGRGSLRRK